MLLRSSYIGIFLFLLIIASCKSLKDTINIEPFSDDCQQAIGYQIDEFLPLEVILEDTFLTSRFEIHSLLFANAYGLLEDIRGYKQLEESLTIHPSSDSIQIELLIEENKIDKRLDQAALELETLSNYIDCHALHLLRVKYDVGELNTTMQNKYTNAAVIAGAASAMIIGGFILAGSDGDEKDWIGVVGGAAAVIIAINSARIDKKAHLSHKKNIIEAIWNGNNEHGIFPAASWYLINQPSIMDWANGSLREYIIESWLNSKILLGNKKNNDFLPTLLDSSGEYSEKMIQLRLDMLEDIENGIDQLLKSLYVINSEMD